MVKVTLDPASDLAAVVDSKLELERALLGPGRSRRALVELSSDQAPRHPVIQLLASLLATQPDAGRQVAFGPRAASIIARVVREPETGS